MGIKGNYLQLSQVEMVSLASYVKEHGDSEICQVCQILNLTCSTCTLKRKLITHVLIENYIPLTLTLAKKFSNRRNRDELVGVSLLALVEAVSRIPKLDTIENFKAYICSRIMFAVKKFILTDGIIKLKVNSAKENLGLRIVFPIKDCECHHGARLSLEVREQIEKVIKDNNERVILDCIVKGGYKTADMADMCGKSKGRISQIKGDLIERLMGVLK